MVDKHDNDNEDSRDFERLRRLGFKMLPEEDEFADQPASSSRIGKDRGRQEYGVERDAEAEDDSTEAKGRIDLSPDEEILEVDPLPIGEIDAAAGAESEHSTRKALRSVEREGRREKHAPK